MFPLVKLVFLLSILSGTANAQWGTVVAQNDTNRFITSQYKYGLVMPHQNVIVGNLDTTITSVGIGGGNASKVIVGSLLDYEDNCANYTIVNSVASCAGSYELWREMEKSTSWYQADRGDTTAMFPTNYAVTTSTGIDSINIWNRDTAELWMAFKKASGSIARDPSGDIAWKDGKLYFSCDGTLGLVIVDFLEDGADNYLDTNPQHYIGNIQQRNDALGFWDDGNGPVLANANVNGVAAVRDPFGLKDALGRPNHWWAATTPSGLSVYNPHTNSIYDSGSTQAQGPISINSNGGSASIIDGLTPDYISMFNTIFDVAKDNWKSNGWDNVRNSDASGGPTDIVGASFTSIVTSNNESSALRNGPTIIIGGPTGAYVLGNPMDVYNSGSGSNGNTRQRWSSTVNAPVEFGNAVIAMALEDNTTDSSPYANTMSVHGSPGTVTAVFGKGYSSTVGGYMNLLGQAEFSMGVADWYVSYWFKSATNPTTTGAIWEILLTGGGSDQVVNRTHSNGKLDVRICDDGCASSDMLSPDADFCDNAFHHVVVQRSGSTWEMYVDGVLVASTAVSNAAASLDTDDLWIGRGGGDPDSQGIIVDDFVFGTGIHLGAESIAKLHAEGRKKLGMGTPVFTRTTDDALLSNNVVDIDALDNGMWAVAFSDANTVQVFDGRIPVQEIAAPAGTVKSVALIQSPGTDSVGVAIGTTTNLKFVQPSVNLRAAMAHQYQEPIHVGESVVVDSTGIGGIFWTGDDAIDAGANANHRRIFVMDGTYGTLSLDQSRMYVECESTEAMFNGKTTNHGIYVTAPRSIIDGCGALTTAGGGSAYDGIHIAATGDSTKIIGAHILDSDDIALFWTSGANVGWVLDSTIDGADDNCTDFHGLQLLVSGNQIRGCGARGINIDAGGDIHILNNHLRGITTESITIRDGSNSDNNIIVGNRTVDGTYGVWISGSGAANNVVVGNRLSGASTSNYTDNGTGTTAAGNNTN